MHTSKIANGNITPSSFVKLDTTAEGKVLLCSTGEVAYGVSQPGTRYAPWSAIDDTYAAIAGEPLDIYCTPNQEVLLRLGGTVTAGDWLKSDSSGFGVVTTSDKDFAGAKALAGGVSGDLVPVILVTLYLSV